jgi:hypothetical protein
MRLVLWNLAVYSAQLAVPVLTAALASRVLPLRVPALLLRYWQLCMAAAVLLPFVAVKRFERLRGGTPWRW